MAKKATGGRAKLYTLTEVASKTGISMPTLQRYKKLYQDRIPSTGEGRKQRYPTSALAVFNKIKKENIGKRGRPRKNPEAAPAPAPAKKATAASKRKAKSKSSRSTAVTRKATKTAKAAKAPTRRRKTVAKAPKKAQAAAAGGLLTLTEIAKRTKISYPTLSRYVKQHSAKLKSEGTGRARRFYEEAVAVFEQLRAQSGRGRKPKAAAAAKPAKKKVAARRGRKPAAAPTGDVELAKRVLALEKQLKALRRELNRPIRLNVSR
ncbi:MAG: hypothetical protein K0U98_01615 [Deltaproteobacteria bacterium]|nr:hypothetical protein [Deltaproteobacteria bacterium]